MDLASDSKKKSGNLYGSVNPSSRLIVQGIKRTEFNMRNCTEKSSAKIGGP